MKWFKGKRIPGIPWAIEISKRIEQLEIAQKTLVVEIKLMEHLQERPYWRKVLIEVAALHCGNPEATCRCIIHRVRKLFEDYPILRTK